MEDRTIYLGYFNSNKQDELFNKSIDYLVQNKGEKFYYILPNGKLLTKYRSRMIEKVGQAFDINLFTFDNIIDDLLEDNFYTYIDDEMKEILLSKSLRELKEGGKLKYYQNISTKKGFVKVVMNIIGEIKRSLITPETYLSKCPNTPFYKELGLIYEEYRKQLNKHGFVDREESFFEGLNLLKQDNSFFDNLDFIIMDGFFDFRPQELELLKEIVKTKVDIYINMPFNRDNNFKTLLETLEALENLGFKIEHLEKENLSYYEQLSNIVFSESESPIKSNSNINVIKAPNSYLEMKKIAEEIKRFYTKGVDLKDMAMVLVNPMEYKNIMFQVFQEEKIPCSVNKDITLIETPLIKEFLNLLNLKKNHLDKKSTINRIKSSYFELCSGEEREAIEYILRKLNFNYIEDLANNNKLKSSNYAGTIEEIISTVEEESNSIPDTANVGKYIEAIIDILDKYKIEEKILNVYSLTKDYDLLHRDFAALSKLKEVLANLGNYLNILYDEITLEEFITTLETYFQKESIIEIQGNNKGVDILTPVTARGHQYRVLFIVGLSEGKYPNLKDENFFISDENYLELKKIGIDIKNYYERLDKQSLMFSTIISACLDILFLSYSENSTGDEKDIPSMFLDEVLTSIEGEVQLINVDMEYILKNETHQLTTKKELSKFLLHGYFDEEFDEEHFFMYNHIDKNTFKEVNNRILCETERNKEEFNEFNGLIGDENIVGDVSIIHKDKKYSISYLESYGKCPYYFLLNNILSVEEMERVFDDFRPLDRGIITHEVLKDYYFNYRVEIENHILGRETFNVDKSYDYIIGKIESMMKSMDIEVKTNLWKMRGDNISQRIINLVKADLDRLSKLKKKAIPMDFEVEFGRRKPFEIDLDGEGVYLIGAIDRIDKYIEEDKYIIIDYKSSEYSVKDIDDMRSGLSLQLPVYILSQKDKKVVAAMYGIISNGEFQLKLGNIEETHLVSKRNKGALSTEELDQLLDITKSSIKSYIDSIHIGDFSVNPKECSPYCIYKDICRYKEVLEVE